eukprot:CAMPEP_0116898690 /NCGR_PEP_ID=MMETSP0467-20121206/7377_1 /TAXON_ID=283647 /ORGANISM="Mesodinium pulex, Strain SPMC105" /LENGTH=68 /DNA_ID=CAMNT_0004570999 /DNA_START=2990 /DNA_END=3193 /DNA_ORIENTATION=-
MMMQYNSDYMKAWKNGNNLGELKKPEINDALKNMVPEVGMIKPGDACMAAHFTSQCGDLEDAKRLLLW